MWCSVIKVFEGDYELTVAVHLVKDAAVLCEPFKDPQSV
jgi:hypothetical protein